MRQVSGFYKVEVSNRFKDEKHLLEDKLLTRIRKHWLMDFIPVMFCSMFWLYIQWIFFGSNMFVAFILPFVPLTVLLFALLMFEVNEMMVFGIIFNKKK